MNNLIISYLKKQVEIYLNDGKNDGTTYLYLLNAITEAKKYGLRLITFFNPKITFNQLFDQ